MKWIAFILAISPFSSFADTYLPENSLQSAMGRSALEGSAMGVMDGSPWWNVVEMDCGAFIAFEAHPRDSNGMDFTENPIATTGLNSGNPTGLSSSELNQVLTHSQMVANGCTFWVSPQ